jgi:hypothetical protein
MFTNFGWTWTIAGRLGRAVMEDLHESAAAINLRVRGRGRGVWQTGLPSIISSLAACWQQAVWFSHACHSRPFWFALAGQGPRTPRPANGRTDLQKLVVNEKTQPSTNLAVGKKSINHFYRKLFARPSLRAFAGKDLGDSQGTSAVPVCQPRWPSELHRESPKASRPIRVGLKTGWRWRCGSLSPSGGRGDRRGNGRRQPARARPAGRQASQPTEGMLRSPRLASSPC